MNIETITEQALKFAPASRAYIAEILLESLDYEEDFIVQRNGGKKYKNAVKK
ncbi:MAG: hypothetical protein ACXV8O_12015 [Methylobacter sp.]